MAISDGEPLGRIVTPPTASREIDLTPGVQVVIPVVIRIDAVAADKSRRQARGAADVAEEHGQIAAGARLVGERFLGRQRLSGWAVDDFEGCVEMIRQSRKEPRRLLTSLPLEVIGEFVDSR